MAVLPATAYANEAVCKSLQNTLKSHGRNALERYQLEPSIPVGGAEVDKKLFNIDIDLDDISDKVTLGCPPSVTSGDPCLLQVVLSAGGRFEFDEGRFYLIRYQQKFFAVVATDIDPKKRKLEIYRVDKDGVTLTCEGL